LWSVRATPLTIIINGQAIDCSPPCSLEVLNKKTLAITHLLNKDGRSKSSYHFLGKIKTKSNCSKSEIIEDRRLINKFGSENVPGYIKFDNTTMEINIKTSR